MNFYSISVKQARIPPNTDDQSDWIIITVFFGGGVVNTNCYITCTILSPLIITTSNLRAIFIV